MTASPIPRPPTPATGCERVLGQAYELGFHKLNLPKEVGGLGAPEMASIVVQEEMAVGDAGLASHFLVAPMIAGIAAAAPDKHPFYRDYLEAFVADTKGVHSGAWAVTEPNHGSDLFQFGDPNIHMEATAVRDGDHYVVNGQKSAFVSNGWMADALLLMVNGDASQGMEGTITFAIPGNLPGITRGKPLNKLGLRGLNQAEIFFDNVQIAPEFVMLPPGPGYQMTIQRIVTGGNTAVGTLAVGVARAAYEEARAYAKQRVQGGRPICQYDSIKLKLFNAYRQIEAARALLWRSSWLIATGRPHLPTAMAARTRRQRYGDVSDGRHGADLRRLRHLEGAPRGEVLPGRQAAPDHGRHERDGLAEGHRRTSGQLTHAVRPCASDGHTASSEESP